jgi:hypothetical protein
VDPVRSTRRRARVGDQVGAGQIAAQPAPPPLLAASGVVRLPAVGAPSRRVADLQLHEVNLDRLVEGQHEHLRRALERRASAGPGPEQITWASAAAASTAPPSARRRRRLPGGPRRACGRDSFLEATGRAADRYRARAHRASRRARSRPASSGGDRIGDPVHVGRGLADGIGTVVRGSDGIRRVSVFAWCRNVQVELTAEA